MTNHSISSLLDYANSTSSSLVPGGKPAGSSKTAKTTSRNASVAPVACPPSPGPFDITSLPEPNLPPLAMAAPISSVLHNVKRLSSASGPLKKRPTTKHGLPCKLSEQQQRTKKPRRVIPEDKEYIPEHEQPTDADVVGGRGGRSNHHPGNRPYWIKVLGFRFHYRTCQSDSAKTMIAQDILNYIKNEKGGRFLNLDSKTNRWFVLPDAVVLDKIKQALRDKYIPFWAKNLEIPFAVPGSMDSVAVVPGMKTVSHTGWSQERGTVSSKWSKSSSPSKSPTCNHQLPKVSGDGNKLGFLLSASRATGMSSMAAIPSIDDALKCKIDTLPTFGQSMGALDTRLSFSFPHQGGPAGVGMGGDYATTFNGGMGMAMFHSVQNANLLASMASLGGGGLGAGLSANGIMHGFGMGTNTGAPSLTTEGLSPPFTTTSVGGLFHSSGLQSADLEKYLETSKFSGGAKSVDLLSSLTGGGLASLGSLGAISFGSPESSGEIRTSTSPVPASANGRNGASSAKKKTDWNAMFKKAIKKQEEV